MGFFKNLSDKAKEKVNEVKSNVSKQDVLDVLSDVQKTLAEGGNNDMAKAKAAGKLFMGLGKIATGKYEGASQKLDSIHKDPYDIQMADETRAELNETLKNMLNPRKFIYADPATADEMGIFILESMNFFGLAQDKTLIPRICEHLDACGVHYDADKLKSEINSFIHNKEVTQLLSIREQVDKFIFIDRMTKEEILTMNEKYNYNLQRHYKYKCIYCGKKFETAPRVGWESSHCQLHPYGPNQGPHKVKPIEELE